MLTTFAHHLRTAGVTLNRHMARRTTLYHGILGTAEWNSEKVISTISAFDRDQLQKYPLTNAGVVTTARDL